MPFSLRNVKYLLAKNNLPRYFVGVLSLEPTRGIVMAAGTEHTQNLRLKETQMNLGADPCGSSQGEDFDDKLRDAQQQLELLQHQREELERQKSELDELNCRKEEFINGQIEITERLATSVTDRKSTRLNSSHALISYAVFCLKKKKNKRQQQQQHKQN